MPHEEKKRDIRSEMLGLMERKGGSMIQWLFSRVIVVASWPQGEVEEILKT
jgi:hypothetical protein